MPKHRIGERLARFRQIDLEIQRVHHDALEFANGEIVLVNRLLLGQTATVLQLPKEAVRAAAAAESSAMRQGLPGGIVCRAVGLSGMHQEWWTASRMFG